MKEIKISSSTGRHSMGPRRMGAILLSAATDASGVRLHLDDKDNDDFWLEFVLSPDNLRELTRLSRASNTAKAKMTAEEFRAKYPSADTNENCLLNIACSHCGSRSGFTIQGSIAMRLEDDGTDDEKAAGFDYDESNYCRCRRCGHEGVVADFTIPGLDD